MEDDKLEIKTPFVSVNGKTKVISELISILALCVTGILAYAFWIHGVQASTSEVELKYILKENQKQQNENFSQLRKDLRDQNKNQQYQTCLLSLPLKDREKEYNSVNGWCSRITR